MNRKHRKSLKQYLAGPYLIWMTGFTIIPLFLIAWYGLTDASGSFTLDNVLSIATPEHAKALFLSLGLSLLSTAICLLLAYPLAYSISRSGERVQRTMVMIIMLPMWMNFLLRTYAWMTLLEDNGLINQFFRLLGLLGPEESLHMINTNGAVVLGMVYNFLPFMVLPLYSVMTKIDSRVIEAAQDLGSNGFQVLLRVILPLSVPGILSGITMVFVPAVSTFVITKLLGGSKVLLIGDAIETMFIGQGANYNVGAALSLVLMVLILLCMAMTSFADKDDEEGGLVL